MFFCTVFFSFMMCILFIYLRNQANRSTSRYRLILASNRDEEFGRPSKLASFWEENSNILAGKDMTPGREGGTWLGVSKTGRIGVLLNDVRSKVSDKKGRGSIVTGFISSNEGSSSYLDQLLKVSNEYSPFQLIAIDVKEEETAIRHISNIDGKATSFGGGVYGFSNGSLAEPYQKANGGKTNLEDIVKRFGDSSDKKELLVQSLLGLLKCTEPYQPDPVIEKYSSLPKELLPALSAINVQMPSKYNYGTRAHTVILVDEDGMIDFYEWTRDDNATKPSHYSFKVE